MKYEIVYLADEIHYVEELAALHHTEWSHLSPDIDLTKWTNRLRQASGKTDVPIVLAAVNDSSVLGSVALVKNDMRSRPQYTPWLAAVYVKPELRKKGIASALVARAEMEAALLGVNKLYLFSELHEQFYARRGWDLIEHADYRGTQVAVMNKALNE